MIYFAEVSFQGNKAEQQEAENEDRRRNRLTDSILTFSISFFRMDAKFFKKIMLP